MQSEWKTTHDATGSWEANSNYEETTEAEKFLLFKVQKQFADKDLFYQVDMYVEKEIIGILSFNKIFRVIEVVLVGLLRLLPCLAWGLALGLQQCKWLFGFH